MVFLEMEQLKSRIGDLERQQLTAADSRLRDEQLGTLREMERVLEICRIVEAEKRENQNLRQQLLQMQQETGIKIRIISSVCE